MTHKYAMTAVFKTKVNFFFFGRGLFVDIIYVRWHQTNQKVFCVVCSNRGQEERSQAGVMTVLLMMMWFFMYVCMCDSYLLERRETERESARERERDEIIEMVRY